MKPSVKAVFGTSLIMLGSLVCLTHLSIGEEPQVRWRNIVRKKLPADVAVVALEYTVLLHKDGSERPIDPGEYKFAIGDEFRIRIEPKDDIYIYIFTEGPKGEKACLLPETDEHPTLAKSGKIIELPADGYFQFETPPGEEKLIVVAAAEPSKDLAALANAVFQKQDQLLTPKEKEQKQKIVGQFEKKLQSTEKEKLSGAKTRGVLSKESVDEFSSKLKSKDHGTFEEPPHGAETSTFAMAVSHHGARKPELLINISLKSIASEGKKPGAK